jgi:hypothetical protein
MKSEVSSWMCTTIFLILGADWALNPNRAAKVARGLNDALRSFAQRDPFWQTQSNRNLSEDAEPELTPAQRRELRIAGAVMIGLGMSIAVVQ